MFSVTLTIKTNLTTHQKLKSIKTFRLQSVTSKNTYIGIFYIRMYVEAKIDQVF